NEAGTLGLFINAGCKGKVNRAHDGFIYAFPNVTFEAGTMKAVASLNGKQVAEQELQTAGAPVAIKLTEHTGRGGLRADGADVVFFDVEVVDAQGRRCPTDDARVDFAVAGPG